MTYRGSTGKEYVVVARAIRFWRTLCLCNLVLHRLKQAPCLGVSVRGGFGQPGPGMSEVPSSAFVASLIGKREIILGLCITPACCSSHPVKSSRSVPFYAVAIQKHHGEICFAIVDRHATLLVGRGARRGMGCAECLVLYH